MLKEVLERQEREISAVSSRPRLPCASSLSYGQADNIMKQQMEPTERSSKIMGFFEYTFHRREASFLAASCQELTRKYVF
jgi:hypothetical protein